MKVIAGLIVRILDFAVEAESTRRFDRLKAPSGSRGSRSQLRGAEASTAESRKMRRGGSGSPDFNSCANHSGSSLDCPRHQRGAASDEIAVNVARCFSPRSSGTECGLKRRTTNPPQAVSCSQKT